MLKQIFLGVLLAIILAVIMGSLFFHFAGKHACKIAESNSMPHQLNDGIYKGEYYTIINVPAAKVQFTVKNSRLTNFWIIYVLTVPGYKVKGKIHKSISNEGLLFDAVTGATISSRFIQAAIMNAAKAK
ncbi:FMN-binding protein [bacterium]|nr:FMN-binding protein [bacterium]